MHSDQYAIAAGRQIYNWSPRVMAFCTLTYCKSWILLRKLQMFINLRWSLQDTLLRFGSKATKEKAKHACTTVTLLHRVKDVSSQGRCCTNIYHVNNLLMPRDLVPWQNTPGNPCGIESSVLCHTAGTLQQGLLPLQMWTASSHSAEWKLHQNVLKISGTSTGQAGLCVPLWYYIIHT